MFAVMRDKNTEEGLHGDDWYDGAVPLLDEVWRRVQADQPPPAG